MVAQTVAMPLENEINGVEDLLYFSSTSSNSGSYSCSVTFRSGTDSDIALVNLQNAVKRAEAQLPSEVTKVGITVEKRGNDILAMLAFQTDGTSLSLNELVNYMNNNVKDALARLEGLSSLSYIASIDTKIISKSNMLLLKKISEKYLLDKERIIIFQFE